jgi:hypothetical protein
LKARSYSGYNVVVLLMNFFPGPPPLVVFAASGVLVLRQHVWNFLPQFFLLCFVCLVSSFTGCVSSIPCPLLVMFICFPQQVTIGVSLSAMGCVKFCLLMMRNLAVTPRTLGTNIWFPTILGACSHVAQTKTTGSTGLRRRFWRCLGRVTSGGFWVGHVGTCDASGAAQV